MHGSAPLSPRPRIGWDGCLQPTAHTLSSTFPPGGVGRSSEIELTYVSSWSERTFHCKLCAAQCIRSGPPPRLSTTTYARSDVHHRRAVSGSVADWSEIRNRSDVVGSELPPPPFPEVSPISEDRRPVPDCRPSAICGFSATVVDFPARRSLGEWPEMDQSANEGGSIGEASMIARRPITEMSELVRWCPPSCRILIGKLSTADAIGYRSTDEQAETLQGYGMQGNYG